MKFLRFLRRTHVYAGLFMVPWVVLYAASGLMFNHPNWFGLEDDNGASLTLEIPAAHWRSPAASDLANAVVTALNERISRNARKYHLEASDVELSPPLLSLKVVTNHGERWAVLYNLQTAAAEFRALPVSLGPARFLTQLHKSRGYPDAATGPEWLRGVRTIRAVFVDAMATLLVFWVVSGVTMWLQLKGLRRTGYAVLGSSLVVTGLVWWGMHSYFTRGQ